MMKSPCGGSKFTKCYKVEGCSTCKYNIEAEEYRCVYCGEDKRFNTWKHIAEIAEFLQGKIKECQEILGDMQSKIMVEGER